MYNTLDWTGSWTAVLTLKRCTGKSTPGSPFSSVPASKRPIVSVTSPETGSPSSYNWIAGRGERNRSFEGTYIEANESRSLGTASKLISKAPPGAIGGAPGTSPIGSFGSSTVSAGVNAPTDETRFTSGSSSTRPGWSGNPVGGPASAKASSPTDAVSPTEKIGFSPSWTRKHLVLSDLPPVAVSSP